MAAQKNYKKQKDQLRVLIVEDEKHICTFFQEILEANYRTTACTDPRAALGLIEKENFDLVITDLKMPEVSGLEILKAAKARDEYCEVLIITGYATMDSAIAALNMGATSYLMKPVSMQDFVTQVDKAAVQRSFHLKSRQVLEGTGPVDDASREHFQAMASMLEFTQKLSRDKDHLSVVKLILEQAASRLRAPLAGILIKHPLENSLYLLGEAEYKNRKTQLKWKETLVQHWNKTVTGDELDPEEVKVDYWSKSAPPVGVSRPGESFVAVPCIVVGRTLALLFVSRPSGSSQKEGQQEYLHLISNVATPLLAAAYSYAQNLKLATTDGLTNIYNHRSFHEHLDREINRSQRQSLPLSLIMIDLDHFKQINDTHGHQAGDQVLKKMVQLVEKCIRKIDLLCRYGGEEFVLILPSTGLKGARVLAERVRQTVEQAIFPYGQDRQLNLTISLGINCFSGQGNLEKEAFIKGADEALYQAKAAGRNTIKIYRESAG